jgi:hypothetical protein
MAARRDVLDTVAGTLLPGDEPLIGRDALVARWRNKLSKSQVHAAVNTATVQPFMVRVGSAQVPATMASSLDYWMRVGRHQLTSTLCSEAGKRPPGEGKRPRGRPRKPGMIADMVDIGDD